MAAVRPIAMGVKAIRIATPGDGVPGTDFTTLPQPLKGAVTFNFADPKEVKIDIEGSQNPLFSKFVKDATDYIEFSIPTPDNATLLLLCGGKMDNGGAQKDIWTEPVGVADITKTFQCETEVNNGTKVVYTIVKGKVMAKITQAPTSDQPELLMVRVYKQAAITTAGEENSAFTREVVSA